MMGPSHAMSGALAGAVVIATTASTTTPVTYVDALVLIGLTAGAALLPDIDSPSGTLAQSFGPLSHVLSKGVSKASAGIGNATRGPKDRKMGGHRTFTHTLLFTALITLATFLLASVGNAWVTAGMFMFLTTLALRGLFSKWASNTGTLAVLAVATITTALVTFGGVTLSPVLMATAVGLGVLTHLAGDAVTVSGIPALAPFVSIRGKRWYDLHILPGFMQFRAAGPVNTALLYIFAATTVGTVIWSISSGLIA